MSLEASAEIIHADECIDDGGDNEDNGEHGEGRERLADSDVELGMAWLVNADQLQAEID